MDANDAPDDPPAVPAAVIVDIDVDVHGEPPWPGRAGWRLRGGARAGRPAAPPPPAGASAAAAPTDPPAPEQARRDGELWQLARRARRPVLRVDIELRTPIARQLFRRDFVFVSRQLYALESSRRVQALDPRGLDDALAALHRRADDVQALLARLANDLRPAIARRAPAGTALAAAAPVRFQATIVTPLAHRFLTLLTQADDTLAQLETAWLLGLVEPARRTALGSDCRRALHGFKDLAATRRQAIGAQVRAAHAAPREASTRPGGAD